MPPVPTATWPIALLGVPFDPMTLDRAVERIEAMIATGRPHYVVTPNVDFLVQARRDGDLRRILAQADLVLCDGKPLVWASRWLGNALPDRVAGSDLAPALLRRAAERGWRIFLLGGAPGVAAEASRRMAAAFPGLPLPGHYSPPNRPLAEMNNAEIAAQVRAYGPDLALVCFGCPKQEKWIFSQYRTLGVPVLIGAGGTVDFLAGRLKRAPAWMRRTGAEWLYRLWQEPRRLARRYGGDLLHFFPAIFAQRWRVPPTRRKQRADEAAAWIAMPYGIKVEAGGRLHRDALHGIPFFWSRVVEQPGHCLVDLARVKSIDSTGLAFLSHWQRRLAERRRNLILTRPSAAVRSALDHSRLTDHFVIAATHRPAPAPTPAP